MTTTSSRPALVAALAVLTLVATPLTHAPRAVAGSDLQVRTSPSPANPLEVAGPDGPYPPTSPEDCVAKGAHPTASAARTSSSPSATPHRSRT